MTLSRTSDPPNVILGWPLFIFLSAIVITASFVIPVRRIPFVHSDSPFSDDATSSPVAAIILNSDRAQLAAQLSEDLAAVSVVSFRPKVLGYERERFGAGWAQSLVDGNYCDTRDHVLRLMFTAARNSAPQHKESTTSPQAVGKSCAPATETTAPDPYTGKSISPSNAHSLDIDHLFPLSAAWDLGAYRWDQAQRRRFANDIEHNLVATDSATNREKSDATLAEWLPPDARLHCGYATAFVAVARAYELSLTEADATVAREQCGL